MDKRNRPKQLVVETELDHVLDPQDRQQSNSEKQQRGGQQSALVSMGSWILMKSWKASCDYFNAITCTEVSMDDNDALEARMQASRKEKAQ